MRTKRKKDGRVPLLVLILAQRIVSVALVVIIILPSGHILLFAYTQLIEKKTDHVLCLFLMLCSSSIPHVTGCVGVFQPKSGSVEIIPNDQGNRITPSYVAFTDYSDNNQRLVGDSAKNQATLNPTNTIFDVKRFIGRKYSDPSVQSDKKLMPYDSLA